MKFNLAPSDGRGGPATSVSWSPHRLQPYRITARALRSPSRPPVAAVPFHFNISGSVTGTGLSVTLTSRDAQITISVAGPPGCHLLGELGQALVNAFLAVPFPLELSLSQGQTSARAQLPLEGGGTITATATRRS